MSRKNLHLPEPFRLWRWAAMQSRRADGRALSFMDFIKRASRGVKCQPGEKDSDCLARALLAETQKIVLEKRMAKKSVPVEIEELLAREMSVR